VNQKAIEAPGNKKGSVAKNHNIKEKI